MNETKHEGRWAAVGACVLALALGTTVVAVARTSRASDHEDSASRIADPEGDIADVFAFMRPGDNTHMVLAMTVDPSAKAGSAFAENVEYKFRILGTSLPGPVIDPTNVNVTVSCRFEAPLDGGAQPMLCNGNGFSKAGTVGVVEGSPTDTIRIFGGLRADPAFSDVPAVKATVASGQNKFTDAGVNSFAGKTALAIVVEVDVDKVLFPGNMGPRPVVAVSAETERLP